MKIGRTGYGVMVTRNGRVIAHPESSLLAVQLSPETPPETRRRLEPLVRRMLAGASGFEPLVIDGQSYRAVFRPINPATGWLLAALYPENELMADARRLSWLQTILALGGLSLLAGVVVALSRRLTAPLHGLADRARQLATGDLDLALPPVTSRDELGTLTAAFHHMRDSLKEHIRTLRETTAAKERLESELKLRAGFRWACCPEARAGGAEEGFEVAAHLVPARAVGGDLYVTSSKTGELCSCSRMYRVKASQRRSSWPGRRRYSMRWLRACTTPARC